MRRCYFKIIAIAIALFTIHIAYSQEYSVGLKGGFNYSVGNEGSEISGKLGQFSANSDLGYLAGVFGEMGYNKFFFRPEVFFSFVSSEFRIQDRDLRYSISKINVPILFGYNIYGPIDVYAGPAYQNITKTHLDDLNGNMDLDQSNFNGHFGVKFIYAKWEVDLRYEYVPPTASFQYVNIKKLMENAYFDDGRLSNYMISINYKIFDTREYASSDVLDE